jgi:hypothetical protein
MSGIPVVISENGFGLPVRQVDSGAPVMTVADNGFGMPIVLSDRGAPYVVQGGGGYNPISALSAKLLEYWEANRLDTMVQSGGLVSQWTGLMRATALTQGVNSSRPAYSATGFAGKPCLTWDGIDDILQANVAADYFPNGANPVVFYALVDQTIVGTDGTPRTAVMYGNGGNGDRRLRRAPVSNVNRAQIAVNNAAGTLMTTTRPDVDLTGRHVMRARVTADTAYISVDGGAETSIAVVPNTTITKVAIGALSTANQPWQGAIAAVLITSPLTVEEDADLMAWLNSRR